MSYHRKLRPYSEMSALTQLLESATVPRPTYRFTKITERREITVTERRPAPGSTALFAIPPAPAETTRKWSSERIAEVAEMFE